MSKKSKSQLKANLYENDYDYLEEDDVISLPKIKIKHAANKELYSKNKVSISDSSNLTDVEKKIELRNKLFGGKISDKSVSCNCNKCGHHINGILVSTIYSPISDLVTPFISYECSYCNHIGFRRVKEKSLISKEFDIVYF